MSSECPLWRYLLELAPRVALYQCSVGLDSAAPLHESWEEIGFAEIKGPGRDGREKVEDSIGDGDEQIGNCEVSLGENCFAGSARTVGATFGADWPCNSMMYVVFEARWKREVVGIRICRKC